MGPVKNDHARRWMWWFLAVLVALQLYFVRELIAALLLAATGCDRQPASHSRLATTVAGRQVVSVMDCPGFMQSHSNGVVVSTYTHRITVEGERVLLNGDEIGKLPATAKKVELKITAGILMVYADNIAVLTKQLPKDEPVPQP